MHTVYWQDRRTVLLHSNGFRLLQDFLWACMTSLGLMSAASRRTVSAEELQLWIESPIHQTYTRPPLPTVLSLESMLIDKFDVYCWCSFVLDKMHMLSDFLKVGLRILMASGRLELMVSCVPASSRRADSETYGIELISRCP